MSWAIRLAPTGLWPPVEPPSHPSATANARGSALVLRGVSLVLRGVSLVRRGHTVGLGARHSARSPGCASLASLRPCLGAAQSASGCGTCPAGIRTCPAGIRTCPAGPISRFVLSPCCPCVSMHAHYRSLSRGFAPGLMASPNTDTGALTRAGCGVPQCRLFVKGEGFAPVLTRSLRAATSARSLDK